MTIAVLVAGDESRVTGFIAHSGMGSALECQVDHLGYGPSDETLGDRLFEPLCGA